MMARAKTKFAPLVDNGLLIDRCGTKSKALEKEMLG